MCLKLVNIFYVAILYVSEIIFSISPSFMCLKLVNIFYITILYVSQISQYLLYHHSLCV